MHESRFRPQFSSCLEEVREARVALIDEKQPTSLKHVVRVALELPVSTGFCQQQVLQVVAPPPSHA
jgi:hypothetical protein